MLSVSLNLEGLLKRETKLKASDLSQDLMGEIDLSIIELPRGELVIVQIEECGHECTSVLQCSFEHVKANTAFAKSPFHDNFWVVK